MSSIPFIDIHTHQANLDNEILSILNLNLKSINKGLPVNQPYSIGIHPWDIGEVRYTTLEEYIQTDIAYKNPTAIGEIGLDKVITTDLQQQKEFFIEQLQFAKTLQKPVIIHCVKAHEELLRIKKAHDTGTSWIFHGYNKNVQLAEQLLKIGFYLSFGETLLHNEKLISVFKELPLDKIFLETDDSDISIKEIYITAAEVKGIEIDDLKKQILLNYIKCF